MKIPDDTVIWRDSCDSWLFHIGVKQMDPSEHCHLFSLRSSEMRQCFGVKVRERAEKLPRGKPVPLEDVLNVPVSDTPQRRTVPLTDAEVLKKLPVFITTVSGRPLSKEQMEALIEKIRWA